MEDTFNRSFDTGFLYYESRIIWEDASIHRIEAGGKVFNKYTIPVKIAGGKKVNIKGLDLQKMDCHIIISVNRIGFDFSYH